MLNIVLCHKLINILFRSEVAHTVTITRKTITVTAATTLNHVLIVLRLIDKQAGAMHASYGYIVFNN